jgi:hypothetical protein
VRREIRIGPATTFYEITGTALPPPTDLNDFVLLATIFYAMRAGEPLHITGCVSRTILQNIEEFQEAWALWRPNEYRVVKVSADEERAPCSTSTKCGVFAFSGGVDGTFALLKHHFNDAGRRTCIPAVMMLIHGFDIPLAQSSAFAIAEAVARDFSETLGVPLATVRTDWKTSLCKHWELEFGAAVAACLHQFAGLASVGVFGADEDYGHLEFPWGSNPATNHLLSGNFRIHTEGAGFTRTARVQYIAEYPEFAARLRVCWEGPISGRNCGRCEKCTRTQLNFMAFNEKPICFEKRPSLAQVVGIKAKNPVQIAYLEEIHDTALRNNVSGLWLSALSIAILKNRLLLPARPLEKRLLKAVRGLIGQ